MRILINGQSFDLTMLSSQSLHQALKLYLNRNGNDNQHRGTFAVALNGDFIGKESYQHTLLKANDSIDVLFPIQGG